MYTYCHTIDVCLGLRAWNGIKLSSSNESSVLRSFLFRPENQPGLENMARIGSITTVCNLHLFRTCSVLVFSCSPSRWTFRIPSCNVISNCLSICQSRGSVLSGWTDIWMSLTHCSFRSWLCSSCGCTTEVRWTYWRTDLTGIPLYVHRIYKRQWYFFLTDLSFSFILYTWSWRPSELSLW
jgi:hypothetical protein